MMEPKGPLNLADYGIYPGRGFLPKEDPLIEMPGYFKTLDIFGRDLPELIKTGYIDWVVEELDVPSGMAWDSLTEEEGHRAMMIYGFGASAYIHSKSPSRKILPLQLAKPLWHLSEKFGKPPILSYCSYALNNWRRKDSSKDLSPENLELLQNFISLYDEDWFILVHVAIEAKAALVVESAVELIWNIEQENNNRIYVNFTDIYETMKEVIKILKRMPEHCSEEVYHREVRPWIKSLDNVVYNGVNDIPHSFRGETGAQSSIVPLLVAAFNIEHKETGLTRHLDEMRRYMPPGHRKLIEDVGRLSRLRERVIKSNNRAIREAYTCCLEEIYKFRRIHYEYATSYIHNRTNDPLGTGGTPFMAWLKQLLDETEAMYLK